MKLFRTTLFIIISVLIMSTVLAQDSEYKVFYFSGEPKMQIGNKSVELIRDSYIPSNAVLDLKDGSYVVLLNSKDVPIGFDKQGKYSLSDIGKVFSQIGGTNITAEFFDYISQNIVEDTERIRRSGGVYRAVGDIIKEPFDEAIFLNRSVTLHWKNPNKRPLYLKIYDIETWEQPYNIRTTDSIYVISLEEGKLETGKQYAWTVYHGKDHPQQGTILRVFTFADEDWKNNFNETVRDIESGDNPDFNKIKLIREYMDNNIYPVPEF
jgi:hypothetical protein